MQKKPTKIDIESVYQLNTESLKHEIEILKAEVKNKNRQINDLEEEMSRDKDRFLEQENAYIKKQSKLIKAINDLEAQLAESKQPKHNESQIIFQMEKFKVQKDNEIS